MANLLKAIGGIVGLFGVCVFLYVNFLPVPADTSRWAVDFVMLYHYWDYLLIGLGCGVSGIGIFLWGVSLERN